MSMLGRIGKIRILPQYGKSFYHRSDSMSIQNFHFLPENFSRVFFIAKSPPAPKSRGTYYLYNVSRFCIVLRRRILHSEITVMLCACCVLYTNKVGPNRNSSCPAIRFMPPIDPYGYPCTKMRRFDAGINVSLFYIILQSNPIFHNGCKNLVYDSNKRCVPHIPFPDKYYNIHYDLMHRHYSTKHTYAHHMPQIPLH